MAYITREDGEHFVIPSYRDVLTAKNKNVLKKDILLLSQSYGEYITLQRKAPTQYEVAFSPDTGYLLGESIWQYFKRPIDMIYCEAIPNTMEAILVIVKSGSVYLDGSFPVDSILEELIIFLTQQNNFEIYIYGDVPISEIPEEGKFSFETASVKSFNVLDQPVFPTLPLLKAYQLQLVDQVLKAQGIGVFPTKQLLTGIVVLGLLWFMYSYLSAPREAVSQIIPMMQQNPYQEYFNELTSPAPRDEMVQFANRTQLLFTLPGWVAGKIDYSSGSIVAAVTSGGSKIQTLSDWARNNGAQVEIRPDGIYVMIPVPVASRPRPTKIYALTDVIAAFTDRLSTVYPGNHLTLGKFDKKGPYRITTITVSVDNVTPTLFALLGEQMQDLPFVLQKISLTVLNGNLSGTIIIQALGS